MSASTLLVGTPAEINEQNINLTNISCQSINCSGAIASSAGGIVCFGSVVAGANVNAIGDVTCQGVIFNNAGGPVNPTTTEIGRTVAGSQVQANQQLIVNGPVGLGEVYDEANNRIVPGANTTLVQFNNVAAPVTPISSYTAPSTGTYVFTIVLQTSNSGFAWTIGTTYFTARLTLVGIGVDESEITIPIAVAPTGAATNLLVHNYDVLCDLTAGSTYTFNWSTDGGVINLGTLGSIEAIIQPLIA